MLLAATYDQGFNSISMHRKRWITALIALPVLFVLILKGGPQVFTFAVVAVSSISLWEYFRIVFGQHTPAVSWTLPAWAQVCGTLIIIAASYHDTMSLLALLVINLIGTAFFSIQRFRSTQDAPLVAVKSVFGVVYIPLFLSFLIMLYTSANGVLWVFFLLVVIAAGDTGAYYVGTFWGRRKLCPAVSPKKTVEGAVGGLAANLALAWLFKLIFLKAMVGLTCTVFAVVVGVVGQAGDLFESEFKRAAGVKDSGNLLPGHGGFLDRLDALLFAAPVAYLLKEFLLP